MFGGSLITRTKRGAPRFDHSAAKSTVMSTVLPCSLLATACRAIGRDMQYRPCPIRSGVKAQNGACCRGIGWSSGDPRMPSRIVNERVLRSRFVDHQSDHVSRQPPEPNHEALRHELSRLR